MARVDPAEFRARDLRVHAFLGNVPLHDVWSVDLPGHPERTLDELGPVFSFVPAPVIYPAVLRYVRAEWDTLE